MPGLPTLYLSRPAAVLPDRAVGNDEVLARVRESFRGSEQEWEPLARIVRVALEQCGTQVRYFEEDTTVSPGAFAAKAAEACLRENGVAPTEIDLVIYGGVARDAFEPATAAEVAGRIGADPLVAIDVTCACAGLLEAVHVAAGYFAVDESVNTALICAGELSGGWITHDLQTMADVMVGVAGLTLGNAASAILVTREALATGGARLLEIRHQTRGEHWQLCRAPVDGHFQSRSKELFALGVHVAPEVRDLISNAGWTPEEVDHYAFHQPSEGSLERIFDDIEAPPRSRIHTHALYGNTASTAWALALDHRLRQGAVKSGDKIVMGVAAAGFTLVTAAAVWEDGT